MNPAALAIAAKYGLRRSGARHVGQCPQCGGSSTTDRFVLFDDGGYKCFSCGFKGDRVKWLREMEGMSCREAHDQAPKACRPSCPQYGPCREGQPVQRPARRSVAPRSAVPSALVPIMAASQPSAAFQRWAATLCIKAKAALAREPEQIAWLGRRGIPPRMADHAGLGWLGHDLRVKRAELGLPVGDDGRETIWIPSGLVIPTIGRDGQIHRLRIRRTPESMARFLPERKYEWIRGSGTEPMCVLPVAAPRGVVIVEAELDALACAAAHPETAVIALGTVAGGLPGWQHELCRQAPVVLVALDADQGDDRQEGAGPRAVRRWLATYRQARFWPVLAGKDPGDYVRDHGGDLRGWIEAGLPPAAVKDPLTAGPSAPDQVLFPDQDRRGDGGEVTDGLEGVPVVVLADGREMYLTDDQAEWMALAEQGKVVWSRNELARVHLACSRMSEAERVEAVAMVAAAKEIFGAAWVSRGAPVEEAHAGADGEENRQELQNEKTVCDPGVRAGAGRVAQCAGSVRQAVLVPPLPWVSPHPSGPGERAG